MVAILTVIHVLDCVALIFVVLLQAGKGAGLAGVFGASSGGGAGAVFGGRGAEDFLKKATAGLAILFMVTSIALSLLSGRRTETQSLLMQQYQQRSGQEMPMEPMGGPEGAVGGEAGEPELPPLDFGTPEEPGGGETPVPPEGQ